MNECFFVWEDPEYWSPALYLPHSCPTPTLSGDSLMDSHITVSLGPSIHFSNLGGRVFTEVALGRPKWKKKISNFKTTTKIKKNREADVLEKEGWYL